MAGTERIAAILLRLADAVEQGRQDAVILEALRQARAARSANGSSASEAFRRVDTVLDAWQQVWPRMGGQRDFRMAVAREARRWAKELA